MNVYLIVHPVPKQLHQIIKKPAYVIAVDQGLFDAYKQGIEVDMAIGDFDSLEDKNLLKNVEHITLNPEKDLTDTESAIIHAQSLKPNHIYILGGLGGMRFEHSYANLLLIKDYDNVSIISDQTVIKKYSVGCYTTDFKGYINIFSLDDAILSLKGFKYELNNHLLKEMDRLGISNELKNDKGTITVHQGKVLIMYTKK